MLRRPSTSHLLHYEPRCSKSARRSAGLVLKGGGSVEKMHRL